MQASPQFQGPAIVHCCIDGWVDAWMDGRMNGFQVYEITRGVTRVDDVGGHKFGVQQQHGIKSFFEWKTGLVLTSVLLIAKIMNYESFTIRVVIYTQYIM
jgi:hypothetical protein